MLYLILIFLNPDKGEVLRAYEREAVRLMAKHGGHFERVFRPRIAEEGEIPNEIHLLSFDTENGFAAFRADPELETCKRLREEAVRHAVVMPLKDYPLSDYFSE